MIGERLVTPSAIVFLLVKLRVKAPGTSTSTPVQDAKSVKKNDEIDEKFLNTRGDAEVMEGSGAGYAHAPYWPGVRLNKCDNNMYLTLWDSCAGLDGGSSSPMINRTGSSFRP